MRNTTVIIVFALLLAGCGRGKESATEESQSLTPEAFSNMIGPDVTLIDVRTSAEVEGGRIAGSINIDFNAGDFDQRVDSLDHDATYLVYCASGVRSGKAADLMREKGFEAVYTLKGGLKVWPFEISK